MKRYYRAFSDDASEDDSSSILDAGSNESGSGEEPQEPEYTFPGFKVEFSEKIQLMPPAKAKP